MITTTPFSPPDACQPQFRQSKKPGRYLFLWELVLEMPVLCLEPTKGQTPHGGKCRGRHEFDSSLPCRSILAALIAPKGCHVIMVMFTSTTMRKLVSRNKASQVESSQGERGELKKIQCLAIAVSVADYMLSTLKGSV